MSFFTKPKFNDSHMTFVLIGFSLGEKSHWKSHDIFPLAGRQFFSIHLVCWFESHLKIEHFLYICEVIIGLWTDNSFKADNEKWTEQVLLLRILLITSTYSNIS